MDLEERMMPHDSQQVTTMRYAFITNRALRAISAARRGRPATARAPDALRLAADFLLEMRRGVAFPHDSQAELGYSSESLPAATRALGVIERLSLASQISQIQDLLEDFETRLRSLAEQPDEASAAAELEGLEQFFRALNQDLTEEVAQATLGSTLENSRHANA